MNTNQTADDNRLLTALLDHSLSLAQIAESLKLTLFDLIAWADSPHIRKTLEDLIALAETRLRLHSGPRRAAAIDTLHQLLKTSETPIESRRIATTLLRATAPTRTPPKMEPIAQAIAARALAQATAPPDSAHAIAPPADLLALLHSAEKLAQPPRIAPSPAPSGHPAAPPEPAATHLPEHANSLGPTSLEPSWPIASTSSAASLLASAGSAAPTTTRAAPPANRKSPILNRRSKRAA